MQGPPEDAHLNHSTDLPSLGLSALGDPIVHNSALPGPEILLLMNSLLLSPQNAEVRVPRSVAF